MTDVTHFDNRKSPEEFIETIRKAATTASNSWRLIAETLCEADDVYGTDSDAYKRICKQSGLSLSTVSKLTTIARCSRLSSYWSKLSAVHSWGTLYAISAMDEAAWSRLAGDLKLEDPNAPAPFITLSMVDKYRRPKKAETHLRSYAIIQIDEQALRSQLLAGAGCSQLNDLLEAIEATSEYIVVRRNGLDEKCESSFMNRIEIRQKSLVRQAFRKIVNAKLKSNRLIPENQNSFECRVLGMSKAELVALFENDHKAAFETLGHEYSAASFYDQAQSDVVGEADALGKKVQERYNSKPVAHANGSLSTGEGSAASSSRDGRMPKAA